MVSWGQHQDLWYFCQEWHFLLPLSAGGHDIEFWEHKKEKYFLSIWQHFKVALYGLLVTLYLMEGK